MNQDVDLEIAGRTFSTAPTYYSVYSILYTLEKNLKQHITKIKVKDGPRFQQEQKKRNLQMKIYINLQTQCPNTDS